MLQFFQYSLIDSYIFTERQKLMIEIVMRVVLLAELFQNKYDKLLRKMFWILYA